MPYPVECFLETNEDLVQILLMLEVHFTQDSEIEDLFRGAITDSELGLFSNNFLFCLGLSLQHNFARVTDKAGASVVLAEL